MDAIARFLAQTLRVCLPDPPTRVRIDTRQGLGQANNRLSRDEMTALFAKELGQHRV